jgi:hypothetical protein
VSRGRHIVQRFLNLCEWSEAVHGPVVGDEWSAQQVGCKPGDRRLTGALEAGDKDEDRLTRVGAFSSGQPKVTKEGFGEPPIWSKGNSSGRNQPTSEVSSPSGRGVPAITVASKTVTT